MTVLWGSKKNIRNKLALMGVHRRRRIPYRRPPCTQSGMSLLTMLSCGFIAFPREIESAYGPIANRHSPLDGRVVNV
jgi:hypothetical protein